MEYQLYQYLIFVLIVVAVALVLSLIYFVVTGTGRRKYKVEGGYIDLFRGNGRIERIVAPKLIQTSDSSLKFEKDGVECVWSGSYLYVSGKAPAPVAGS